MRVGGSSADWEEISKNQDGQRHCCHDVVANEICVHCQPCATAPEEKNESYFSGKHCSDQTCHQIPFDASQLSCETKC